MTQVIETHMAFVFLTRGLVYKLKKPLRSGHFDHRSRRARAHACAEEVRLNRMLADGIYIASVPLVLAGGRLSPGGEGKVVDWLVKMRRLPEDRMLDAVIRAGQGPKQAEVAAVVALLSGFYRRQQSVPVTAGRYLAHLRREQRVNATRLRQMAGFLPDAGLLRVLDSLSRRLAAAGPDIAKREAAGLVIEGHGDLRPEHVCLTDPPVIFDRAETAVGLRVLDVFDEVAYLAAECAMLGRPDLGPVLMTLLESAGFAPPARSLQATYTMFRLITRARLALDHLRDVQPRTPEKWPLRAHQCLTEAIRLSAPTSV